MPVVGKPRSYHKKYNFNVEIDGLTVGWFESCSPIEGEMGIVVQREGGSIVEADQSPGLLKHAPVTLKIGATDNDELYQWWLLVVDSESNTGAPDELYKKNVAIVQKDRDGSELRRWNLFKAWPHKMVVGEWEAKAEENVMQELTLVYHHFKVG